MFIVCPSIWGKPLPVESDILPASAAVVGHRSGRCMNSGNTRFANLDPMRGYFRRSTALSKPKYHRARTVHRIVSEWNGSSLTQMYMLEFGPRPIVINTSRCRTFLRLHPAPFIFGFKHADLSFHSSSLVSNGRMFLANLSPDFAASDWSRNGAYTDGSCDASCSCSFHLLSI
jgi:hypothetical protein